MKHVLVLLLITTLSFNVFSDKVECIVTQQNGNSTGKYDKVEDTRYDIATKNTTRYLLSCKDPGTKDCTWPSTHNGESPCDGGVWKGDAVKKDIDISDNGTPLGVTGTIINQMVLNDININLNTTNFFLIGGNVGVFYELIQSGNENILRTIILTGTELQAYLNLL